MQGRYRLLAGLLVWLAVLSPLPAWSRSFPSTSDALDDAQQRWGSVHHGYIADGCWHGPSETTSATVASCRAFALVTGPAPALQGFEEATPRTLTYSAGDGTYWLGGRAHPGALLTDWTCLPGTHYCWKKQDTPPAVPSGLVLLGQVTVSGSAVTAFVIQGPWRRTTPYLVPAGTTLTFGVCPEGGRWPIVTATGTGSGRVRFAPGSCARVFPEWWGVDGTGMVDSTALWAVVIHAVSVSTHVPQIACAGVYAVSSSGDTGAIILENYTQIVGEYTQQTAIPQQHACTFKVTGTGHGIVAPDVGSSYDSLRLENLTVWDVDETASRGIYLANPVGTVVRNVEVRNFQACLRADGLIYYGDFDNIRCHQFRLNGITLNAQCNGCRVTNFNLSNSQHGATSLWGFRLNLDTTSEPGVSTDSKGAIIQGLVEVTGGTPVIIDSARGLDATFYIEQPGLTADYANETVSLQNVDGGRLHLWSLGKLNQDIAAIHVLPATNERGTRNLIITGQLVNDCSTYCVIIDASGHNWGIDYSGFSLPDPAKASIGSFSTGTVVRQNYLTAGVSAPGPYDGRVTWLQGDVIWRAVNDRLTNTGWRVLVGGATPTLAEFIQPTLSELDADSSATPAVFSQGTYFTRLVLDAGTNITGFTGGVVGQTLLLRARAARTLVHSATLVLCGATNYAMTGGSMALLALDGAAWREVGCR